jgi:hypothetical protein
LDNTCLITTKIEHSLSLNHQITNTLYIEDYYSIACNLEARKLTDKIYANNKEFIQSYDYRGYKIAWSWHSDIFQFCINYLEIITLIREIDRLEIDILTIDKISPKYKKVLQTYFYDRKFIMKKSKRGFFSFSKEFLFNLLMLLYSLISIFFLSLNKKQKVASYTGDFVFKDTKSDFRLNHLYKKYKENNINYVEFIRSTNIRNFFINIFKRKRFSIYYTSIIYFINLMTKKSQYTKEPLDFSQSILFNLHHSNIVFIRSIPIIEKVFKILKINNLISISFSSRSAHISVAAKSLNIKTIGIMHGLSQRDYLVQEFMESYNESKKIGCDVYGVWSPYFLEYFKKYSKVMYSENIFYSGLLRPIKPISTLKPFERISNNKLKVLIISEPLISVNEVIPFLEFLLKHDDIEISIKVRPMIKDIYFDQMKKIFPPSNDFKFFDGAIEDIAHDFDVFLGSHSTAVIEASLFGKISIVIDTLKFGDYFGMDDIISQESLLVKEPELIYENILYRVKSENSLRTIDAIRKRFFGKGKDGVNWILKQL